MTRLQSYAEGAEMTRATGSDRSRAPAKERRVAREVHDRIEAWVNEGGAGGEPDESTSRPRGG